MVKILIALWHLARRSLLANAMEFAGAAAIVYGFDVQVGRGAAWLAAGVALVLKAFEVDLDRPEPGTDTER